jgi:hypothetical protein
MLDRRFTCVRLSHPYLTWSVHAFDHNVHHRGHCAAAACGSLKPLPAERLRGTFPHLSYSMKLALLLGTTEGSSLISLAVFTPPHCRCIHGAHSGLLSFFLGLKTTFLVSRQVIKLFNEGRELGMILFCRNPFTQNRHSLSLIGSHTYAALSALRSS